MQLSVGLIHVFRGTVLTGDGVYIEFTPLRSQSVGLREGFAVRYNQLLLRVVVIVVVL